MIPPEKIETYRKVRALADRPGTDGEGANARAVLIRLETLYPGIREAAASGPAPPPPPPGATPDPFWSDFVKDVLGGGGGGGGRRPPPGPGDFTGRPPAAGPSAREVFDALRDFLKGAQAEVAADEARRTLADEHTDVTSRWAENGDLVIRVRVDRAGRRALNRLAPAELWALAAQVGKDVADELVGALEEERAEEEAPPRRRVRR